MWGNGVDSEDVLDIGENVGLEGVDEVGELVGEFERRLYRAAKGICVAMRAANFQMSQ